MKQILLFGAGKSATILIDFLLNNAASEAWHLTVVDTDINLLQDKLGTSLHGTPLAFDSNDHDRRYKAITAADIVISLLPPALHYQIAKDCLKAKKNLLTASYADESLKKLTAEITGAGLLFLCEMGLDPGIDHMSAKKLIDTIHADGGKITSFLSHCGGLVAKESDTNPWHYKISWNPRNVVAAGKAGAVFKESGEIKEWPYQGLFSEKRYVAVPGHESLCWYPNRDSLSYLSLYNLEETATFIRTTLRHPDFMYGWKNIIELGLTSEDVVYQTDGVSLLQFFKEHLDKVNFSDWLDKKLHSQFDATKDLLSELVNLVDLEKQATAKGIAPPEDFMMVDEKGDLQNIDIDYLKINAAATLADRMHDANLTLKQLFFLGMDDDKTIINKGLCSAATVLQFALEKKLMLQPHDKDMVVMLHEINFTKENKNFKATSSLILEGCDSRHTAMAQTVGLPLAIATRLILNGSLAVKGLQIPISKEIYEPVLSELARHGILFREEITESSSPD